MMLKTQIPTTDDLLRFLFNGIKGRNWVDIYFGPEMNPNKTFKNQFDVMEVGPSISLFKYIRHKEVLLLKLGNKININEIFALEINVFTKVRYCN